MDQRPARPPARTARASRDLSGATRRGLRSRSWDIVETAHPARSGTAWHKHERSHICLVVAGEVEDGSRESGLAAGPGALLFFPAGVDHANRFSALGARCLNLRAHGSRVADELEAHDLRTPVRIDAPEASWLAGQLYDATVEGDAGEAEGLARRLVDRAFASGIAPAPPDPEWLVQARRILEGAESKAPGLAALAERVGVDRFRLARRFRRRYGCSVGQYRHRLQIQQARHALLVTDAPLSSVAYRAGFADQSHFTRLFRRYTGMTPGTFRLAAR